MTKQQQQVKEFHQAFQCLTNDKPTPISIREHLLRYSLISEELGEFAVSRCLEEVSDALGDILYVVLGSAVAYGIDLEPVFDEIHRSNMSKLWLDEEIKNLPADCFVAHSCGTSAADVRRHVVKRNDGKVIKSPSYLPANIAALLKP